MSEVLIDFQQAQQLVLERVQTGSSEEVALPDALGRVLADDVYATHDLPRYDNSAMDGFAVRAGEVRDGSRLDIIETVAAGTVPQATVATGKAIRIMTGAAIPRGADAVVPIEEVEVDGDLLILGTDVPVGQHIRYRGEDLSKDDIALAAGIPLCSTALGLLSSFGLTGIPVRVRPKVAILATGDELVPPGAHLEGSQIYDSNTTALCSAVREAGGEPVPIGIARDDRKSLTDLVKRGLEYDALVTAAGASVGEYDLVRSVLSDLQAEELFWGVSIKPGKPTAFCLVNKTPVFCLPGNPVSALVTFELFVRPALRKMIGCAECLPEKINLPLAEPFKKKPGRTLFARVKLVNKADGVAVASAGSQQTGILTSLVEADALAILPGGKSSFKTGEVVEVLMLR